MKIKILSCKVNNQTVADFLVKLAKEAGLKADDYRQKWTEDKGFWTDDNARRGYGFCHTSSPNTVDEVIEALTVKKKEVSLSLNTEYVAKYTQGDTFVSVGCQKIDVAKIKNLVALIDQANT